MKFFASCFTLFSLCFGQSLLQTPYPELLKEFEVIDSQKGLYQTGDAGIVLHLVAQNQKLVYGEYASAKPFEGEKLWELLDRESHGGIWLEINPQKKVSKEIEAYLNPKASQHWVLWGNRELIALAEVSKSDGYYLRIADIRGIEISKTVPSLSLIWTPQVLRDFVGPEDLQTCLNGGSCKFSHELNPQLKVQTANKPRLSAFYQQEGTQAFVFPSDCNSRTEPEKAQLVENLELYADYHFGVALNAFVQSLSPLFSWQDWQWYSHSSRLQNTGKEFQCYVSQCVLPSKIPLATLKAGSAQVEFFSDLQGGLFLEIIQ